MLKFKYVITYLDLICFQNKLAKQKNILQAWVKYFPTFKIPCLVTYKTVKKYEYHVIEETSLSKTDRNKTNVTDLSFINSLRAFINDVTHRGKWGLSTNITL